MTLPIQVRSLPLFHEIEIHFHYCPALIETLSLSQLPVGAAATVVAVDAPAPLGTRLRDLGLHPGTPVRCLRRAPLGDPRIYELRGVQLCLRRSEADLVQVSVDG